MFLLSYHEHNEEGDGPDGTSGKLEHNLGIRDEDQARAGVDNLLNARSLKMKKMLAEVFL